MKGKKGDEISKTFETLTVTDKYIYMSPFSKNKFSPYENNKKKLTREVFHSVERLDHQTPLK